MQNELYHHVYMLKISPKILNSELIMHITKIKKERKNSKWN